MSLFNFLFLSKLHGLDRSQAGQHLPSQLVIIIVYNLQNTNKTHQIQRQITNNILISILMRIEINKHIIRLPHKK